MTAGAELLGRIDRLLERSYRPQDVPRFFTLAFEFFPSRRVKMKREGGWASVPVRRVSKAVLQLADGKIEGVKGISSRGDIAMSWLGMGGRDALLVMKADDVLAINRASRFMYDNPKYLLSKNGAAFSRMLSGADTYRMMQAIFQYGSDWSLKHGPRGKHNLGRFWHHTDIGGRFGAWMEGKSFDSALDLARELRALAEKTGGYPHDLGSARDTILAMTTQELAEFIEQGVRGQAAIYADEGEWSVKSGTLKVPKGSVIYLLRPSGHELFGGMGLRDIRRAAQSPFGGIKVGGKIVSDYTVADYVRFLRAKQAIKRFGLDRLYRIKYGVSAAEMDDKRVQHAMRAQARRQAEKKSA